MSEPGLGVYLYCILPPGSEPDLDGLTGVDGRSPVEAITSSELTAIMSRVPLDEFGPEPLKHNLEDLQWLERTARAHDAVLAAVIDADAVVPMRLLTIFTDDSRLLDMLERERGTLAEALDRLRRRAEWSVKLMADRVRLENAAREQGLKLASATTGAESPGRAYFARKQGDRAVRQRARELAEAAASRTHAMLGQHAAASRLLPAQHPELSGRSGDMILNGAYLVDRDHSQAFSETAEQLREEHRRIGLALELSGPWAPYNFVSEAQEASSAGSSS